MSRRGRKRNKAARNSGDQPNELKEQHFFQPFRDAAKLIKQAEPTPEPPRPQTTTPDPGPAVPRSDDETFLAAMAGVKPLAGTKQLRKPPPPPPIPSPETTVDEDQEALFELGEFVAGQGPFDIVDTDEHVEGAAEGLDPRILRRLRKGDYSLAGHIDLHGRTRDEARDLLTRFIVVSRREQKRCVLVVHGRGLHSKDQQPVLKEAVVAWLGRSALRKQILAFCTARHYDGGAGALYVLLRR